MTQLQESFEFKEKVWRDKEQLVEVEARESESRWQLQMNILEEKLRQATTQVQTHEAEKDKYICHKREVDVLKVKMKEYEDKIRRQVQYMKSRLLKDKTNTHSSVTASAGI